MADGIKIATVNCQGLATLSKRQDVLNFYKTKNYSILCLQDTHFVLDTEPYVEAQWGYKCVFNSFTSNSRGVCILFNNNFEFKILREKKDNDGNMLALDLVIEENKITLINVYGPNTDTPGFYEKVRETFLEFDNDYFVLCGDLNIALNASMDTYNYLHVNNPKARDKVLEIMEDLQMVDYYRILYPENKIYTWKKKNPVRLARLDYILISESLSNVINNISIKPGYRSDHSAVIMEIKFNSFTKGHGLWKFNNSLLHDEVYVEKVKQTIQLVKETFLKNPTNYADNLYYFDTIDDSTFLEVLLMEIRGIKFYLLCILQKKGKGKRRKIII